MLEQPGVKDEEFELIQLIKCGQRVLHLGNVVDPVQHSSRNEPFDGFFKVPCPAAFPDSAVHEFFVGLCKLCNNAAEYH